MLIQYLDEAREGGLADPTIADLSLPELQVCVICTFRLEADISTNSAIVLRGMQKGAVTVAFWACLYTALSIAVQLNTA